MSSYVVDPKTINTIIQGLHYASKHDRIYPRIHNPEEGITILPWMHCDLYLATRSDAASLGQALYEMNINATWQRYPGDDTEDSLPGTHKDGKLAKYQHELVHASRYAVYEAIREYLYQCSEGDVDELPLFIALSSWQDALAHRITRHHIDQRNQEIQKVKGA